MTKLLHVIGSPRGNASRSAAVADAFLDALRSRDTTVEIDTLDLWQEALPEFDGDKAAAKMTVITGGKLDGATATAWDVILGVVERFNKADVYLFTVPMWNGGIPYKLKLYIDILTQPGLLFGFDPAKGYTGLLAGKRAAVVYTSGVYANGVAAAYGVDFQANYFGWWLDYIGIKDITEIRYQPTLLTADPEAGLHAAREAARAAATSFTAREAAAGLNVG